MTHTTDQNRAQFDAWIRTHEEEHGAVDEASAWAAWTACSLMQASSSGVVQEGWTPVSERLPDFMDCCDWLMPMTDAKRERWILSNESMATASVPGVATHWRKAQALPELPPPTQQHHEMMDEIINMADEIAICSSGDSKEFDHDGLLRFAAMLQAKEREECALACEIRAGTASICASYRDAKTHAAAVKDCASAIRARTT